MSDGTSDSWDETVRTSIEEGAPTALAQVLEIARWHAATEDAVAHAGLDPLRGGALVNRAMRFYSGTEPLRKVTGPRSLWLPITEIPAYTLSDAFSLMVADVLAALGQEAHFEGTRRSYLENLLFHPLQNVLQHARRGDNGGWGFAGLIAHVVNDINPALQPSVDYAALYRGDTYAEFLIFDAGDGIAQHYYSAKNPEGGRLLDQSFAREWLWLKTAFERHASSKYFEKTADSAVYSPGIGLAALLSALKYLNGYMDVRCGRTRGYQFFGPDARISRDSLIKPEEAPAEELYIRGTIVRIVVPLAGSKA